MKMAFEVLKDRVSLPVVLTRDSVCMGDDCAAPHEERTEVYSFLDPVVFVQQISNNYLPAVAGTKHTWTCLLNGVRIAEVTCSDVRPLTRTVLFAEVNEIHFVYHSATC